MPYWVAGVWFSFSTTRRGQYCFLFLLGRCLCFLMNVSFEVLFFFSSYVWFWHHFNENLFDTVDFLQQWSLKKPVVALKWWKWNHLHLWELLQDTIALKGNICLIPWEILSTFLCFSVLVCWTWKNPDRVFFPNTKIKTVIVT